MTIKSSVGEADVRTALASLQCADECARNRPEVGTQVTQSLRSEDGSSVRPDQQQDDDQDDHDDSLETPCVTLK